MAGTGFVCAECGVAQGDPGMCMTDRIPLSPIGDDLLLGTTIGAYRVARLLGIGGMGRVYKGAHPTIGSRVAIKVLSRECSDRGELVDRFFQEARAVNLIRHESIVNVLDLAVLPDGRPFIIMEYLDGAPLSSILEHAVHTQTPLPLGGLARLAVEVLDALGAAHAKGIVHRDLKPDNIYVAPSGRPKVLDFGIAKLSDLGGLGSATRTGSLLGTPHYMSPEQAAGRAVDHRADIYAMGVILFECATGVKPFHAEALFDLLRKHVEELPPPPRSYRPDLSPEIESVILTALAKSPDLRFASAQAMSMALQHATSQLPPEHWQPITASGNHRQPSGAWQPTPPASWGAGSRAPARSSEPVYPPADPARHPSTVSASSGQIQSSTRAPSKKGLWMALAGVALIGGVVTAAVVASSNSSGNEAAASGPSPPAVATSDKPATPAKTDVAPGGAASKPVEKATTPVEKAVKPAQTVVNEPSRVRRSGSGGPESEALNEDEAVDAVIESLPKDMQKELGDLLTDANKLSPALRKQIGDLSKLPAGKRAAKVLDIKKQVPADDDPPPVPPPPPARTGWVEAHSLALPSGWNPKHADPGTFIAMAMAEAKKAVPDAKLVRVELDGVGPDGRADLTLATLASDHGTLELRFISPSRAVRDPKIPLGVRVDWKCEFRIEAEPGGITMRPINGFACKDPGVPVPRCSPSALWKRAIAAKAPTHAVANLSYYGWQGAPARWHFSIGFGTDDSFSQAFDDGC